MFWPDYNKLNDAEDSSHDERGLSYKGGTLVELYELQKAYDQAKETLEQFRGSL
jgi:hypothetical protein